jgi:hypothetical protein
VYYPVPYTQDSGAAIFGSQPGGKSIDSVTAVTDRNVQLIVRKFFPVAVLYR